MRRVNGYLFIATPPVGRDIDFHFPLSEPSITLSERLPIKPIRVRLRGDSVVGMDNFGEDLTFFDPYEPTAQGATIST